MPDRFRKQNSTSFSGFPILLIGLGVLLIGLWSVHRYFYLRSISLSDTVLSAFKAQRPATTSYPIHIRIDNIADLPVVESGKENGVWTVSDTSANHVIQSALPGENGNIIIYGHNLNTIFGYLMNIKVKFIVYLTMTDGTRHKYSVIDTEYVSPDDTRLLAPTTHEVLTLYTCAGLLDSLRFVARAVPAQ